MNVSHIKGIVIGLIATNNKIGKAFSPRFTVIIWFLNLRTLNPAIVKFGETQGVYKYDGSACFGSWSSTWTIDIDDQLFTRALFFFSSA